MIYYVEDERNIRELTVYTLMQSGLEVEGFGTDAEFRAACERRLPDAILLDIMLPDADGLQILKRLRANPSTADIPVMMVTAKDTEFDTVVALDGGADDYLSKPFGMMELVSRCRALLRRARRLAPADDTLTVGDLALSPSRHEVSLDGAPVSLTLREFDLLAYLMAHPGIVCTRDSLLKQVWGWDFDGGSRTVDVHVQTLRSKLEGSSAAIETVRGVGYRLRG
ncbi:MAG: response regulator transcription factor [Coriobacteriia bacterium]|nr:response regulator transcription factor [Coriobacteriia bacterium]MBS5477605.1 response regulator transcription factor [Coriobacteriia bacterium]